VSVMAFSLACRLCLYRWFWNHILTCNNNPYAYFANISCNVVKGDNIILKPWTNLTLLHWIGIVCLLDSYTVDVLRS
jgi:hypothetical protein